jgi:hypothetical protein
MQKPCAAIYDSPLSMDSTSSSVPEQLGNSPAAQTDSPAEQAGNTVGSILSSSKTQLAIGVAATLGVMVFYKWREKQLAKKDPEEYARLQRIKASVRSGEIHSGHDEDKTAKPDSAKEIWPPAFPSAQSDSPP